MRYGNDFFGSRKDHAVFADNGAAADRMYAEFFLPAFFHVTVTIVNVVELVIECIVQGIGNHQRGTGRRVELLVVVGFDDFDVEVRVEHFGGFPDKTDQYVDSERHVAGIEDGCLFGKGVQTLFLVFAETGRAHDERLPALFGKRDYRWQGFDVRKIDDYVEVFLAVRGIRIDGIRVCDAVYVTAGRDEDVFGF